MEDVSKLKVEIGRPTAVCDFCLEKGIKTGNNYRLVSEYRKYRCLNICPKCLVKIRKVFK